MTFFLARKVRRNLKCCLLGVVLLAAAAIYNVMIGSAVTATCKCAFVFPLLLLLLLLRHWHFPFSFYFSCFLDQTLANYEINKVYPSIYHLYTVSIYQKMFVLYWSWIGKCWAKKKTVQKLYGSYKTLKSTNAQQITKAGVQKTTELHFRIQV